MLFKLNHKAMFWTNSILVILYLLSITIQVNGNDCTKKAIANKVDPTVERSKRRGSKNKAEIKWQYPTEILSDRNCYNLPASKLEVKEGDKEWGTTDYRLSMGQSIKWTVPVKPCLKYEFRIKLFNADNLPQETTTSVSLEALNDEQAIKRGYVPEPITDFKTSNVGENSASLTWKRSECAKSYEINYNEQSNDAQISKPVDDIQNNREMVTTNIDNLKPCSTYDAVIYSLLGENSGEFETQFSTKPDLNIKDKFRVEAVSTSDSVTISWPTWKNISCIQEYKIKTCVNSTCCIKEATVKKTIEPTIVYTETGLTDKQEYTFRIKPIFQGLDLNVKEKSVRIGQIPIFAKSSDDGAVQFPENNQPSTCPVPFNFETPKIPPSEQTSGGEKSTIKLISVTLICLILNFLSN